MSADSTTREPRWKAGLRGARANLGPGFALQVVPLVIVLAYYHHAPTHAAFERLMAFRARAGLISGILSTGLFGGVLPFLYLRSNPETRDHHRWGEGMFLTAFWGYKGLEIEVFYRVLAHVVGTGHDVLTITTKVLLDQLVFSPVLIVPLTAVAYQWCATGFSTATVVADFRTPGWYGRTVLPTLIANAGVWVPAVAIIYAMPTPLQLPLQNLVLCFYTLLLAHLNRRRHGTTPP
jgi:hypothetical protein